jgi:uncharacterized membrane protein YkvA (DUF1232 family)
MVKVPIPRAPSRDPNPHRGDVFNDSKHRISHGGRNYSGHYSDSSLFSTLRRIAGRAGRHLIYSAFVLHHALKSPNCPPKARLTILGALAYLILPVDLVPDFLPVIGLVDDASVIASALVSIAPIITDDIRAAAARSTSNLLD